MKARALMPAEAVPCRARAVSPTSLRNVWKSTPRSHQALPVIGQFSTAAINRASSVVTERPRASGGWAGVLSRGRPRDRQRARGMIICAPSIRSSPQATCARWRMVAGETARGGAAVVAEYGEGGGSVTRGVASNLKQRKWRMCNQTCGNGHEQCRAREVKCRI